MIPRLTRSIFLDQLLWMVMAGLLMGLAFPVFLRLFGFPEEEVFSPAFYALALSAGALMGLFNYGLVRIVIRPAMRTLSGKMDKVANALEQQLAEMSREEQAVCVTPDDCMVDIRSADELGSVAGSFNRLVHTLHESREIQRAYEALSRRLSASLELSDLAEQVSELIVTHNLAQAVALYVIDKGEVKPVFSRGIAQAEQLVHHPQLEKVVETQQSTVVYLPSDIHVDAVLVDFRPKTVQILPVMFRGTVVGVLLLATAQTPDEKQQLLQDMFVAGLGLALRNALTHEEIQRIAVLDGLTGVFNRRFGMQRLKEEYSRAVRQEAPLAVLMADIDHFKRINDTYGHLMGDRVLRLIVEQIRHVVREGDVIVRYGGEEFMIILPGADSHNAMEVAERLRRRAGDIEVHHGDHVIRVTLSIGVASLPEIKVDAPVALIECADEALYQAKRNGRNQVMDARMQACVQSSSSL
ncbi:GGDEF domain-containing protein [Sulfurivirga sp.]|uniref:GGDEF domain-containing protein n=1 Tax=Sulfurivirga sp. TaxID=2614236 RepID=UPI0025EBF37C|nr:diguanylate cyclase [Sulfurivirga sp.]